MAPVNTVRYEPLDDQVAANDCASEASSQEEESERALNDPPDRHEIWNQVYIA
jgi:hypothetical protein